MLDYTTHKKKILPVKLMDGTSLKLRMPRKQLFKRLSEISETISKTDDVETLYGEMEQIAAEILSSNMDGKELGPEYVETFMDIEDMAYLIAEYSRFAGNIVKDPN